MNELLCGLFIVILFMCILLVAGVIVLVEKADRVQLQLRVIDLKLGKVLEEIKDKGKGKE